MALALLVLAAAPCSAQTGASIQGRVLDESGAALPGASVSVQDTSTGFDRSASTDISGRYHIDAIPAGTYVVTAEAPGFRTEVIEALDADVGRTIVRNFVLTVGPRSETVVVSGETPLIDPRTSTVGHVVTAETAQEMPLNGRHFTDLGLLVPGSVSPSQTGFSSRPIRGIGTLAFNTAGNREEAVSFLVNGVSSNNQTFGSFVFEPPLDSIQEFKVDNSAFSAEEGHVSGAIVNLVTRSGTDTFHGDAFEFFRNSALDARNFFEFTTPEPHPFERHQFGGSIGGPVWHRRTFFFASYEGFRQQQGVDLNSLVLSDAQRAAVTSPVIAQLLPLIPRANYFDADGTPRFVGSAPAVANQDRWTIDVRHTAGPADRVHVFYGDQLVRSIEPTAQGNSIPGFGSISQPSRNVLTIDETHSFASNVLNEARFGRTHLNGGTFAASPLNPADFGIGNGVTSAIGLPQMIVAGGLNFGGPANYPSGRYDTSYVLTDKVTRTSGRHSLKFGGEYRYFVNDNFAQGTGIFNFPSVAAFLAGTANSFNITLGDRSSVIDQQALGLFVQDQIAVHDRLTLDVGLRYEWHVTPTERDDKFVVFDAETASLLRVGVNLDAIYAQNNRNIEPRAGIAWQASSDGRTVVRAAYAAAADEPGTTAVRDAAGNPPFGMPLTASGAIPLLSAIAVTQPAGLAPSTIDPRFLNATMHSWNANLQRQLGDRLAVTIGYLGSHGSNLRISRNLNQPLNGVRPFAALSLASPILPGQPLGNITQVTSDGFSNYHGAYVSVTKRLSSGLLFDASYTLSRSLDTNSLNSSGFAVQDGYDIAGEYGPSDFDARHRFTASASYALPFKGSAMARGWELAAIVQAQSGNPVNLVTPSASINGLPNTVRPNVTGPITITGSVNQWFDPSVFVAGNGFGNLSRNAVTGPGFFDTDVSLVKNYALGSQTRLQFRVDAFDVFNHPNFGSPGNIVGSPTFGKITSTRLPTGEAGSSRQLQLAVRLLF
ncbi:MAG TPA: TonB-dependent receptor [Vicinamibacterales bacterium]|jgi:hypothetical protein